ncbi:NAD-dependent epimerase/dehydratase family protein [Erythrobacter aquimaris]|uniref:NAD-dependent epimerase/dehydratase family protein n=1 Tax=Qipengyuania aquimaris TaxID=255984 RepID=A0A6I4TGX3_9SPHN|nr:NAD(P)-dependent oxidoreductase [Qipengyuania aquimaris]MXO95125.1 NAD-dependent epimerase/dehydratase family protein [Qipengyuania aquimaris]
MRIAITGSNGFIGRHVTKIASRSENEVFAIGRANIDLPNPRFHECDLHDHETMRAALADIRPDLLIHLAWYAEPGKFWSAPENLDWVSSSLELVRAFVKAGGKRVVVSGSCAEYAWDDQCLDECATEVKPASLYGQSKASLFEILRAASPILGFELAWGRIFFPYGPGDRPERLLGTLISAIREGKPAIFSSGTQQRDFMFVEDVASALWALANSSVVGPVNIGTGTPVPVRQFVEEVADQTGVPVSLEFGKRDLPDGEPQSLFAATKRLREEVCFTPQFSRQAAIARTLEKEGLISPASP